MKNNILTLIKVAIVPFILAAFISIVTYNSIKPRFSTELIISPIYNSTITLEALRIFMGYDPTTNFLENYTNKLKNKIDKTNSPCKSIEKNNNVIPFVIVKDSSGIKIQYSSISKNKLEECSKFIIKELEIENKRIANFLISLVQLKNKYEGKKFKRDNTYIDLDDFISFYNFAEKKIKKNTNMSDIALSNLITSYFKNIIPEEKLKFEENDFFPLTMDMVKNIEFFTVTSEKTMNKEKLNPFYLFSGMFILLCFISIFYSRSSFNKKGISKTIHSFLK